MMPISLSTSRTDGPVGERPSLAKAGGRAGIRRKAPEGREGGLNAFMIAGKWIETT